MKNIRINIIGVGHWGPNLVSNFASIRGASIGMVADLDAGRLAGVHRKFPFVFTTTDPAVAINDPEADAVVIVTPVSTHFDLARRALASGKHVFVEKPLCASSQECAELIELAEKQKLTLMVGHVFVFNPGIMKIKEILETGVIGRIVYIDAVRTNLGPIRTDVNALWDLASHDLSIIRYWLQGRPVRVSATGSRASSKKVEDVVFATVEYDSGVVAHLHASWLNPRKVRQITVVGEKKMIVWDDVDLTRAVQVYDHGFVIDSNVYVDSFGSHRMNYFRGDLYIPNTTGGEPLLSECQHFVECISGEATPRAPGTSGKEVVEILEAADRSLAQDGVYIAVK